MSNSTHDWLYIMARIVLARIAALEHDTANWDTALAALENTPGAHHARLSRAISQREATELHDLLLYLNRQENADKIPISLHVAIGAAAIYLVLMLLAVLYLIGR